MKLNDWMIKKGHLMNQFRRSHMEMEVRSKQKTPSEMTEKEWDDTYSRYIKLKKKAKV